MRIGKTSRIAFRRTGIATLALTISLSTIMLMTSGTALAARPENTAKIDFGNNQYCNVGVDDPHVSGGDVSVHSTTECFEDIDGASRRLWAQKIAMTTVIDYSMT